MRTVYEILKEVGLDHKDAMMIDFCYSQVTKGSAPTNLGALTNDAARELQNTVNLYGGNGSDFWSYEELQSRLIEKFPEGELIMFHLPFTKTQADKIVSALKGHEAYYRNGCLLDFQNAWENRKVV